MHPAPNDLCHCPNLECRRVRGFETFCVIRPHGRAKTPRTLQGSKRKPSFALLAVKIEFTFLCVQQFFVGIDALSTTRLDREQKPTPVI